MVNRFTEVLEGHVDDIDLVEQARNGGRAALEKLILRHQGWIDNIAVRMVQTQHDAEVGTQEVLVKVGGYLTVNGPCRLVRHVKEIPWLDADRSARQTPATSCDR